MRLGQGTLTFNTIRKRHLHNVSVDGRIILKQSLIRESVCITIAHNENLWWDFGNGAMNCTQPLKALDSLPARCKYVNIKTPSKSKPNICRCRTTYGALYIFHYSNVCLRLNYEGRTESHEQLYLHANWEQQTKESAVVDGTSCCVILECLVTSIACIT